VDADAAPLVDDEDAPGGIGLRHVAVEELEREVFSSSFFEEAPCLGAGLLDIAAEPWQFFQFGWRQRHIETGPNESPHVLEDGDLRQARGTAPPIDRHRQRLTYAHVLQRPSLVV